MIPCRRCAMRARDEYCPTCAEIARDKLPVEIRIPRRESWGDERDDDIAAMVERGEHSPAMDGDDYDPELEMLT